MSYNLRPKRKHIEQQEIKKKSKKQKEKEEEGVEIFSFQPKFLNDFTIIFPRTGQKIHTSRTFLYTYCKFFQVWMDSYPSKKTFLLSPSFEIDFKTVKRFLGYMHFQIYGRVGFPFLTIGNQTINYTEHNPEELVELPGQTDPFTINPNGVKFSTDSMTRHFAKTEIEDMNLSMVEFDWGCIQLAQRWMCDGLLNAAKITIQSIDWSYCPHLFIECIGKVIEKELQNELDSIYMFRKLRHYTFDNECDKVVEKYKLHPLIYKYVVLKH